ncbi:MAG: glycerophosphodiester phosphodiesterase [Bacteroidetes bacterium]|nr:glycerophosphodiester phosphodiesterase [Bacteroidota bacterium]MDA1336336.1 glycerophosphodiester phosphodiesterase [Bacteroidota bacterium]
MSRKILLSTLCVTSHCIIAMAQSPIIIAHRGFSQIAPENTLSAFESAIQCGAPYFELDVQKSHDSVPIVIHDESLDRTTSCNLTGRIDEYDAIELKKVTVGYPSKFGDQFQDEMLPTLGDALELAQNRINVCVEIKTEGIESEIIEEIRSREMEKQVVIFSFIPKVLTEIHALAPELKILFLKEHAAMADVEFTKNMGAFAMGVGGKTELNPKFMDYADALGIQIWRWTVDDPQEMTTLIELGIDAIITNRPDLGLRAIKE